jgi:uncharacterized glyoxalase superfamily protein PhnB
MKISQITPIMVVKELEPCLPFWMGLGFQCVAEVPHESKLGFAILVKDSEQVMFQSEASIRADLNLGDQIKAGDILQYTDVDSVAEAQALVAKTGARILVGPRTTFYGAKEIWVLTPGGFVTAYAEHKA